ncbi:MAG TPA: hypothetical protein VGQ99_01010 [Tepidisphaeraceae bacterium]|jgi:hypothetical protein|nr:hypothetical protein [Tepidisphaeraceae bacterium]
MSVTAAPDFICSKCKKGYIWYAEYAGKVARCTCGAVIQFPFADPKPKDPLAIPFLPRNIDETEGGGRGPAPMELPKDDLDPKILAERRALGEYFDDVPVPVDAVRDVHGPFVLLAIGLLLISWQVADLAEAHGYGGFFVLGFIIGSIVELGLSLLGVMAAGKLMGVYFGKAKTALYKLSALHVAPSAIGAMITASMGDDAVGKVVGSGAFLLLYWGLFSFMFRIKGWQTLVCVVCIAVVKFIAIMCIVGALVGMFVSRGGVH